jgi:hypothetical protein
MKPGDLCPKCNAGRIKVKFTKRLVDGRYRKRFLVCDVCDHDDTQTVPIDSHGREMLVRKLKFVICPCCSHTIEVDGGNNSINEVTK